jgi:hypothetical protein
MFEGFDLRGFWRESKVARTRYVDDPLTADKVARVERALGVKLPAAYVELMKTQNGGFPSKARHGTRQLTGIFSIGEVPDCSLGGKRGSRFWIEEWEYPPIGVYFADCPSGGHDMLCLDYRACGPTGEPTVVHVDQEQDFAVTLVAPSFESFIRGLEKDASTEDAKEAKPTPPLQWNAKRIKVRVERGAPSSRSGHHLELSQSPRKAEGGWTLLRIDLPGSWQIASAKMADEVVVIVRASGETYRVGPANVGALNFAVLSAGRATDAELEALWTKHTEVTARA